MVKIYNPEQIWCDVGIQPSGDTQFYFVIFNLWLMNSDFYELKFSVFTFLYFTMYKCKCLFDHKCAVKYYKSEKKQRLEFLADLVIWYWRRM